MARQLLASERSPSGISGYQARETTDESPEHVALIQRVTLAYLRHALGIEHTSWMSALKALPESPAPVGRIESK